LSSILTIICESEPDPATAARIEQVFKWIIAGHTEHDIAEAIHNQWPQEQPQSLIVAAVERIRGAGVLDAQTVLGWCFEATLDLHRRVVEIGDFAGALRAVKQIMVFAKYEPIFADDKERDGQASGPKDKASRRPARHRGDSRGRPGEKEHEPADGGGIVRPPADEAAKSPPRPARKKRV
jgi:hypothetical protein